MQVFLENVHKYYNRGGEREVHALKDVSLRVKEGEVVCVQGPSGSGKSTLLSIIGCLYPPTSGKAVVSGRQLSRLPDHFLTRHRRENIGFIFQRFNLIESISVLENITLPLLPLGITPKQRNHKGRELLAQLGIGHREKFRVDKISGGEMQRVAIARALICDPVLILADEPTAHLDSELSHQFMESMMALKAQGKTIVITSHDPLVTTHHLCDNLYTMHDGHLREGRHQ
ncbi:MAG: ABC transporter ATP-binding protein [Desulfocapsaceae bacterium]|nr:ABC transporter ATP-binding protein [Desulfocapsaceae bacterium]